MIFTEFEKLLHGPDMLRIMRGKEEVYKGYFGVMQYEEESRKNAIKNAEVVGFRAIPEIRHRRWREMGLDAPLLPEQLPQYCFCDLMMTLYYTIYLKGETDGNWQDGKCDGYQKSEGDDEPCETCKECKLNTFYED